MSNETKQGLAVWYGPMPESNGKTNWTAILKRAGDALFDGPNHTIARSEYPDRVRYEADRVRHIIGEIDKEPEILDYNEDLHSGYTAPQPAPDVEALQAPIPKRIADQIERTDWTPKEALEFYARGDYFDVVGGRTRIIETGAVASNSLKHLSAEHLSLKGDAELSELQARIAELERQLINNYEDGKREGWSACEACHGIVDGVHQRAFELERQQGVLADALTEYMAAYNENWERGMPILEPMGDAALAAVTPAGQERGRVMLHKNSGRTRRSIWIGKTFIHFVTAEDPAVPWWARTWFVNDTEIIIGIVRFHHDLGQCVSLIIGPLKLAFARLQPAADQQKGGE